MNRLIEYIVKLWFKIPRYQLKFSIDRKHVDDRSFEWYVCRKKHGFDERVLWNLSGNLDDRIRKSLGKHERGDYECVSLEEFKLWFKMPSSKEDIRWFYDRVYKYIEWECPYSVYDTAKEVFLGQTEIEEILVRYRRILGSKVYGMIITDEEIELIYKYDRFGW